MLQSMNGFYIKKNSNASLDAFTNMYTVCCIAVTFLTIVGTDYTKNYLRHEELFKGGIIKIDMSNQPNMNRGTKEEDMPYSFSKEQ